MANSSAAWRGGAAVAVAGGGAAVGNGVAAPLGCGYHGRVMALGGSLRAGRLYHLMAMAILLGSNGTTAPLRRMIW